MVEKETGIRVPFSLKEAASFLGWEQPETYQNGTDQWEKIASRAQFPAVTVHFRERDKILMAVLMNQEGQMTVPIIGIKVPESLLLSRAVVGEKNPQKQKTVRFLSGEDWLQVSSDIHDSYLSSPLNNTEQSGGVDRR